MFRILPGAGNRLSPEATMVAEMFLGALPPFASAALCSVRLVGTQARRFDPESPFDLLVVADTRNIEIKTAVAIAVSAVEGAVEQGVQVNLLTAFEESTASGLLARTIQNARREGVDLWLRAA